MRVFVYEHLTALGLGRDPGDAMHSMYREGLAMRDAVAADFRAIPGMSVTFDEDAPRDRVLCIAPETDGVLLELSKRFADGWLGCSPEAIALTTDKLALFEHWRKHGVRTPATSDREPTPCEAFPVVWKPRDGCGSTDTFLLKDAFDHAKAKAIASGPMILQEYVPGRAASVAFVNGTALIPCWQQLSTDGRFQYMGGELPIPAESAERAIAIASAAVKCVVGLNGYVGVDVVLGEAGDFAIEINPRLTTSYVGLRHVMDFNIAERMLGSSAGRLVPHGEPRPPERTSTHPTKMIRFLPDGSVSPIGPP